MDLVRFHTAAFDGDLLVALIRRDRDIGEAKGELGDILSTYEPTDTSHDYWSDSHPQSMLIEEVEEIWASIDKGDDWSLLEDKISALRRMGEAHGDPPAPQGHA